MLIKACQSRAFIHLLFRGPYHRQDQITQEHRKWIAITHYTITRCLHTTTLVRAKTFQQHPNYSVIHPS